MVWSALAGVALLAVSAWQLNPLCVRLLPIAALGVLLYPLCKRFTWFTHIVLGAVDGLAPLGAFIAVTGTVMPAALALFGAVTVWVAGFDVVYALMDQAIDRAQGIRSLPARFGSSAAYAMTLLLHAAMVALLALAGALSSAPWPYAIGVAAALALLLYERGCLQGIADPVLLSDRVFNANMAFSVLFLATSAASFAL